MMKKINALESVICVVNTDVDILLMIDYRITYLKELQGEMSSDYEAKLKKELFSYFTESIANGNFYALMMALDGVVISFGAMVFKKIPGDINKTLYIEADILNMYTLPDYRGRGASSLILEALIEKAKEMGVSKLSLHTSIDGERLYRKYGFDNPVYPVLERLC